jgi:carbamoyl-phosphate synthase small subunit
MTEPAYLVLEDGTRFRGRPYGAAGTTVGEIVFCTGMTGYQETLTDPSYAGQIVVQTAPQIGNTGTNDEDMESARIWVSGYVVREPSRISSNWRAQRDLATDLTDSAIVGISHVDTRAITRHIRDRGAMRAGIFSGPAAQWAPDRQLRAVTASPEMSGLNLSTEVTVSEPEVIAPEGERAGRVAVVDLGVKRASVHNFARRGYEVVVLPADATGEEILEQHPDGVFFSNGPGDPAASGDAVDALRAVLDAGVPFFGICFGNQLLGRALGLDTYKLPFGHRGINQPVREERTGRVKITAQNHGFAVKAPSLDEPFDSPNGYGRVRVGHLGLNDQVVEGLDCLDIPAFSVQFHPEAHGGPHDANDLFDRFAALIAATAEGDK